MVHCLTLGNDLGDTLILPANMLRTRKKVFLDDITIDDVEKELDIRVAAVETNGYYFVEAVLERDYEMDRVNDEGVAYINGY